MLFTGLGGPDLFNPDEPRETELVRETLAPNLESEGRLRRHFQEAHAPGATDASVPGRPLVLLRVSDLDAAARSLPYPIVEVRRFEFRARPGDPDGPGTYLLDGRGPTGPSG